MSKRLVSRLLGMFQSRTQVGVDKAGNRYFTRVEEVDGAMKERRWVEFKGADQDSTTVPVEWICWLNGQRKKAPTPEELAELEARRERVRQNIELLKKKEEEERKAGVRPVKKIGKSESPNLQSFVKQQFPGPEEVPRPKDATDTEDSTADTDRSSEPTGIGATFKPGTWQPPT
ncbi:NADH dehydrogenase [ubiquinone] 1 alpha subcomplex assembly factor 2-like [Panicum virgatum]|uniref:NADH dehydrogenase [ubiquinone] 1 alpha subcomplex subunit 12 n=1 Tax=Panicum virgatum TaxID=38727 RepID=A0A8T0VX37_PANVG|nr:NADH dehydrogenase [ubiquinone] 1 alpha subcomplex assembly factor 2-like [Panicum virgatum]KAG2635969.1 hypothetical protein PVAP13_2NG409700 [Panicum virgatum]